MLMDESMFEMDHEMNPLYDSGFSSYMDLSMMSNQIENDLQVMRESDPVLGSDQIPAAEVRTIPSTTAATGGDYNQAIEELRRIRNPGLPNPEEEHEIMTRAILAVLCSPNSSPASPSISSSPPLLQPSSKTTFNNPSSSIPYQNFDFSNASTSTQKHHIMTERRRREKLNENFQKLRSLLPNETKKDKVSILSSTSNHLTSLTSQIQELIKINYNLKQEALLRRTDEEVLDIVESSSSSTSTSTSTIDLEVRTNRDCCVMDLTICVLELLKQNQTNIELVSINVEEILRFGLNPMKKLMLRFNISPKDQTWDRGCFQEAVRRVVSQL